MVPSKDGAAWRRPLAARLVLAKASTVSPAGSGAREWCLPDMVPGTVQPIGCTVSGGAAPARFRAGARGGGRRRWPAGTAAGMIQPDAVALWGNGSEWRYLWAARYGASNRRHGMVPPMGGAAPARHGVVPPIGGTVSAGVRGDPLSAGPIGPAVDVPPGRSPRRVRCYLSATRYRAGNGRHGSVRGPSVRRAEWCRRNGAGQWPGTIYGGTVSLGGFVPPIGGTVSGGGGCVRGWCRERCLVWRRERCLVWFRLLAARFLEARYGAVNRWHDIGPP